MSCPDPRGWGLVGKSQGEAGGAQGAQVTITHHGLKCPCSTQDGNQITLAPKECLAARQSQVCSCTGCALLQQACSVRGGEGAGAHQVAHKWDRLPLADVWHAVNDDETTSGAARYTHRMSRSHVSLFLYQPSPEAWAGPLISLSIQG